MTVGLPHVGVRVHVSVQIAERRNEGRVQRLAQVEEHGAPALKSICQKKAALRHFQFRVMRRASGAGDGDRSYRLTVVRRFWVGIKYREEIVALLGVVTRPNKQVGIALGVSDSGTEKQQDEAAEIAHRHRLLPRKGGCE